MNRRIPKSRAARSPRRRVTRRAKRRAHAPDESDFPAQKGDVPDWLQRVYGVRFDGEWPQGVGFEDAFEILVETDPVAEMRRPITKREFIIALREHQGLPSSSSQVQVLSEDDVDLLVRIAKLRKQIASGRPPKWVKDLQLLRFTDALRVHVDTASRRGLPDAAVMALAWWLGLCGRPDESSFRKLARLRERWHAGNGALASYEAPRLETHQMLRFIRMQRRERASTR